MHSARLRSQGEEDRLVYHLMTITTGRWLDDEDETPSFIKERLYLGSVRDARNVARLKQLGVTHVLNIAADLYNPNNVFTQAGYEVTYLGFSARDIDAYPIHDHFDAGNNFIDEAMLRGGTVLVHCAAGVSRSATIVCAYLMRANKWNCYDAVTFVNKQRVCASPNQGFLRSLLRYEAHVSEKPSVAPSEP